MHGVHVLPGALLPSLVGRHEARAATARVDEHVGHVGVGAGRRQVRVHEVAAHAPHDAARAQLLHATLTKKEKRKEEAQAGKGRCVRT